MELTNDFICHDDGFDSEEDELPTSAMQDSYDELMGVGRHLFSGWKKECSSCRVFPPKNIPGKTFRAVARNADIYNLSP